MTKHNSDVGIPGEYNRLPHPQWGQLEYPRSFQALLGIKKNKALLITKCHSASLVIRFAVRTRCLVFNNLIPHSPTQYFRSGTFILNEMITYTKKQMQSALDFLITKAPKDEPGNRTRFEECKVLYNSDTPDYIIVKYRIMGCVDGNEIDELRFYAFDREGEKREVRSWISDPNARWSYYHHCREVEYANGLLKVKTH